MEWRVIGRSTTIRITTKSIHLLGEIMMINFMHILLAALVTDFSHYFKKTLGY